MTEQVDLDALRGMLKNPNAYPMAMFTQAVTKKKRYYTIKRANGDYNVSLFWGWKKWFTHTASTYEDAKRVGKDWVKATPKED